MMTTERGQMKPIMVNIEGKNCYAYYTNIELLHIQRKQLTSGWYSSSTVNSDNFIKSDNLIVEYTPLPNVDNTSNILNLHKYSLMMFTRTIAKVFKVYFLLRTKEMVSFKQFIYFAHQTKDFFQCSKFYTYYKFTGSESILRPTSRMQDYKEMLQDDIIGEVV